MLRIFAGLILAVTGAGNLAAQSWPTYRHDNRRSGVTSASLPMPLEERWVWRSPQPPQTAWTGPAKWDAYSGNSGLQSMRNFDPCFYVTANDQFVYFGSSADDAAHALDAATGQERWAHITGAAVRLPPTIWANRVLFGSDDGWAYCCDASTGDLIWRKQASEQNVRITSNRKIISLWPVRTGVLVDDHRATFAASLVPWKPSFVCTVDTATGEFSGENCFQRELSDVTLQGAMLASDDLLYVPQGRAAPLALDRKDGAHRGTVGQAGGVFCILSEDEKLFAGPPNQREQDDQIRIADVRSENAVVSFSGTNRILVSGNDAWLSIGGQLKKLDRGLYVQAQETIQRITAQQKDLPEPNPTLDQQLTDAQAIAESAWKWSIDFEIPLDMIQAGDVLVLGMRGEVRAISAEDGSLIWQAAVDGQAHGLAVAGKQLYVSTDRGHIYAFGAVP